MPSFRPIETMQFVAGTRERSGTLSVMRDSSGSARGFVKVMRDLTARKSAEAAIAAIHEQLYASKDLSSIEFGPYLRTLVRGLFGVSQRHRERIALVVDAADAC